MLKTEIKEAKMKIPWITTLMNWVLSSPPVPFWFSLDCDCPGVFNDTLKWTINVQSALVVAVVFRCAPQWPLGCNDSVLKPNSFFT